MDLMKLRYFLSAAETGSFTAAAARHYTTQPNISKQISALERALDAKLFIREHHVLRLTRAGEYLYEQLRDLPGQLDRVAETARALARSDTGVLTVGMLSGQRLDTDVIRRFQRFTAAYPDLQFTLERAGFSELRRALSSLRFDIILTFSFDVTPDENLVIESIRARQQPAIFVSRMSPLAALEDFSDAPYIVISPKESYGGYEQFLRSCRRRGFEPNIVRLADSLDSLLFYVETGVGVAVLDRNTRLETDQSIRVIPLDDEDSPGLVAVWDARNKNPNIRKMVDCLTDDT